MVQVCSLGSIQMPKTVYGQGYAYALNKDEIYYVISDAPGTSDPSKYVFKAPVTRGNGLQFGSPVEVWDPQGNIGLNFDLYWQKSGSEYRYTGYGTTQDPCGGTQGTVWKAPLLNEYLCLCDGYSNCNLTSNVGRCYYDPIEDYLICDGADGSKNIWVIKPDFSSKKRITHSSAVARGRFSCVPLEGNRLLCALTGGASGTNMVKIFTLDIGDVLGASDGANADSLPSYNEIYSSTTYNSTARNVINSNGFIALVDAGTSKIVVKPDLSTQVLENAGAKDAVGVTANGILYAEASGATLTIYEYTENSASQVAQYTCTNYDNVMSRRLPLCGKLNDGTTTLEALAICDDNGKMLVLVPDYNNKKLLVYDYIAWAQVTASVIVAPHRLLAPLAWQGASLPLTSKAQVLSNVQEVDATQYATSEEPSVNAEVAWAVSSGAGAQ